MSPNVDDYCKLRRGKRCKVVVSAHIDVARSVQLIRMLADF